MKNSDYMKISLEQTLMYKEICEQPAVIQRLKTSEQQNVASIAKANRDAFQYIMIVARGTSYNAGRYAQYLFQTHNGLPVALATPSVYTAYKANPNLKGALVIGISQSGASPDIVSVVQAAADQGCPTIAITNTAGSALAKASRHVIELHAEEEKAVAATKTYTSSLFALAMLSQAMNPKPEWQQGLDEVSAKMQQTLDQTIKVMDKMQRYRYMQLCSVIGRGFTLCTAHEIALKVKELTSINTEPYSSADFQHGPIATVRQEYPVILISHQGKVLHDIMALEKKVKNMGAETIVISDDAKSLQNADFPLEVPQGIQEWLSPMVNVIPGQLLGLKLSIEKGKDPDKPRGLSKITETF